MPSAEFEAFVAVMREQMQLNDESLTPEQLRASIDGVAGATPLPPTVTVEAVDAGGVPAEWVRGEGAAADAALVYLHGGGYVIGSPRTHRNLTSQLSLRAGVPVLALDYRLAPEHPHPAAVDDATSAYRWLLEAGIAPGRIAIAGDSAGGGLTFATLLKLRDEGVALPAGGAGISPWTDIAMTGESMQTYAELDPMVRPTGLGRMAEWFIGDGDPRDPYASPLYGDLRGLPPLLVHVGAIETLHDDATRFAARATAAGVDCTIEVYPDMIHVFHAMVGLFPEADAGVDALSAWLRERLATAALV